MTSTTPATTSLGQMVLTMLEQDLAETAGPAVMTLFSNWKTHAGNKLLQAVDLATFVNQAPEAGITLEVEVEQQLLTLVQTKVQEFIAAKAPAPVPAAA